MPTLYQPFGSQEEEKQKSSGGQQTAPAPVSIGGPQGGAFSSGSSSAPKPGAPTSSGQFTNIQKLIDANKSTDLAGKIVGNVQQQAQQSSQDINALQNAFQQQSGTATSGLTSNLAFKPVVEKTVSTNPISPANLSLGREGSAVQSPTGSATESLAAKAVSNASSLTPEEIASLQTIFKNQGQYKGPQSLADIKTDKDIGKVSSDVSKLQDIGKQATSESGRFGLLKQMFGKPTYAAGQQKLDSLLLSSNPSQAQKLRVGTATAASAANRQLGQAGQQAQSQAAELAKNVAGTFKGVNESVTGAQGQIEKAAADKAAADAAFIQRVQSGQATPEDRARLLGSSEAVRTYGVNIPASFNLVNPTQSAEYSNEQAANLNALQSILGGTNQYQAGTAAASEEDAKNAILQNIASQKGQFLQDINAIQRPDVATPTSPGFYTSSSGGDWGSTAESAEQAARDWMTSFEQNAARLKINPETIGTRYAALKNLLNRYGGTY